MELMDVAVPMEKKIEPKSLAFVAPYPLSKWGTRITKITVVRNESVEHSLKQQCWDGSTSSQLCFEITSAALL